MRSRRKPQPEVTGYNTLKEAIAACKEMFDPDATIEIHEDECDGENCKCEVVRTTLAALTSGARA